MIVLDTDVVSELMRAEPEPEPRVVRRAIGRSLASFDGLIAATALAHGAAVATCNASDFQGCGIDVIDPWKPSH